MANSLEKTFYQYLDQQNFQLAKQYLEKFSEETLAEKRKKNHLSAQILMRQGHYREACLVLEKTRKEHGSHVGLMADLAGCYYHLQESFKLHSAVSDLETQLEEAKDKISRNSFLRTTLLLISFKEEQGMLTEALQLAKEHFHSLQQEREPDSYFKEIFASHLLRLKTFCGQRGGIGKIYYDLLSLLDLKENKNFTAEIEHSLILAEYELFGKHPAYNRAQRLLEEWKDKKPMEWDFRLIFFDLLERFIRHNESFQDLLCYFNPTWDLTNYEKCLFNLTKKSKPIDLIKMSKSMSMTCLLRLASLYQKKNELTLEQSNQVSFFLSSLSEKNKLFWHYYFLGSGQPIVIYIDNNQITFQDKKITLNHPITLSYLKAGSEKSIWPTDEFYCYVYKSLPETYSYDRVRMQAKRLNNLLINIIGAPALEIVTADNILFNARLKIRLGFTGK